jgi:hypothetical protein
VSEYTDKYVNMIRGKVDKYASGAEFDGLGDRESLAPVAFAALRAVLDACDELDRSDLMAAAVRRIRAAVLDAFEKEKA